jgi:uncharacterized protein YyaL (SSP411 family)
VTTLPTTGPSLFRRAARRFERLRAHPLLNPPALLESASERVAGDARSDHMTHLDAAIEWLIAAQDATPDDGFSRGYSLVWHPIFRRRGWQPSYPETTGYIIPTLYAAGSTLGRPDLAQRAERAARWEIKIQLPSGAVRSGVVGQGRDPAIFNTGQVVLGWLAAHQATGKPVFADAIERACVFLASNLGADGHWRTGSSPFARADATLYNARTAWALAEAGRRLERPEYLSAGAAALAAVRRAQHVNGWIPHCCLTDADRPLLHTLGYAIRGLLEGGRVLNDGELMEGAALAARQLAASVSSSGRMPGRYSPDWSGAVSWSCLTGEAQLANIWMRLYQLTGKDEWLEPIAPVLRFLETTQNIRSRNAGLRGGIKGAFPIGAPYGSYQLLSWATKFFVDALLRDRLIAAGVADEHVFVLG